MERKKGSVTYGGSPRRSTGIGASSRFDSEACLPGRASGSGSSHGVVLHYGDARWYPLALGNQVGDTRARSRMAASGRGMGRQLTPLSFYLRFIRLVKTSLASICDNCESVFKVFWSLKVISV